MLLPRGAEGVTRRLLEWEVLLQKFARLFDESLIVGTSPDELRESREAGSHEMLLEIVQPAVLLQKKKVVF